MKTLKIILGILVLIGLFPIVGGLINFTSFGDGAIGGLKLAGMLIIVLSIIGLAIWLFGGFESSSNNYSYDGADLKRVYERGREDYKESVAIGAYVNTFDDLVKQMQKECGNKASEDSSNLATTVIVASAVANSTIH